MAGGSDSFNTGTGSFSVGPGFIDNGVGLVSGDRGFDYERSLIGDYNSFRDDRNFNDARRFIDFGGVGQFADTQRLGAIGGANGFIDANIGVGSVDRGLSGGFISAGGSNRMVREFGSGGFEGSSVIGGGYEDRRYDAHKLRGFTSVEPYHDAGGIAVGGAMIEPRPDAVVGSKDRVIGVKPGVTTHHSKLTTIVRPVVRPLIRPVVRPVIQRVSFDLFFLAQL